MRSLLLQAGTSIALMATSSAFQLIAETNRPEGVLSEQCLAALSANIDCLRQVETFLPGEYYSAEVLEDVCTTTCSESVLEYEAAVAAACSVGDVYLTDPTHEAPASFIATLLVYNFNRTCISDDGRWCNAVAYEGLVEPSDEATLPTFGNGTLRDRGWTRWDNASARRDAGASDPCDQCNIKQLQFQASSPLYDGQQMIPVHSSLTSSCGNSAFPVTASMTPVPSEPPTTSNVSNCDATTYVIRGNDTCDSIADSRGIATAWLLYDNQLAASCSDFPKNGSLCLRNTCSTYRVQPNDTCASIGKARGLSTIQLSAWNPILGLACLRIELYVGTLICISPPGDTSFGRPTNSTTVPLASSGTPTALPVPTDSANGTTHRCAQFYRVQPGDYCNLLVVRYGISLEDFRFLNQGVNIICTNLFANESYCVKPVGPTNQYPNHPDYVPPQSFGTDVPYDSLPKATFTPKAITGLPDRAPLAEGTRSDCLTYVDGDSLIQAAFDVNTNSSDDVCEFSVKEWAVTLEQFTNWNPSLMKPSGDCAPESGQRYCVMAYKHGNVTASPDLQSPESSSISRPPEGLNATVTFASSSSTILSSLAPASTRPSPPGPTQKGVAETCTTYHLVEDGEECTDVSKQYGITLEDLYEWNPAIASDCLAGFWEGYAYCVAVAS